MEGQDKKDRKSQSRSAVMFGRREIRICRSEAVIEPAMTGGWPLNDAASGSS